MKPSDTSIDMPAPTIWPLVTAFALMLTVAGLITHAGISLAGLVLLARGAWGWWSDVLPAERHERVVLEAPVPAIAVSRRGVVHLLAGTGGHRVRVPAEIHPYSSGVKGGAVGAVAMAIVATTYGLVAHGSLWFAVNLLSAGLVPSLAAADLDTLRGFSLVGLLVGIVMHSVLSVFVGLLYAVLLPMFPKRAGLWSGLATPIVWSGLVMASLDVINPTLNSRINWTWFVASQVAFGLTCGYVVARSEQIETRQSWTFESRAGLEARRDPDKP
jgi:hypothetical protein